MLPSFARIKAGTTGWPRGAGLATIKTTCADERKANMYGYDQWRTGDPCSYRHCKIHGAWISDGDPHSECPDCYEGRLDGDSEDKDESLTS